MPIDPHDPAEIERRAQIGILRGQQPTSNTMPVGGGASVLPSSASNTGINGGGAPALPAMKTSMLPNITSIGNDHGHHDPLLTGGPITALGGTVQPSIFPGSAPKHAMEGFDFSREQNTGKSAKDAFAYLSNQAPPPPLNDKAALGAWFNQYIKPGMDGLGHKVSSVNGDKFRYSNHEGEFDVDFGRGAGAEGGALAWQADVAGAPAQADAAAIMGSGSSPMAPMGAMGGDDNSALARIMAELQATQKNEQSPAEREAMLAMLHEGI